ncbi:MAG TPA: glycosyltransferase [Bacteroidales bacterium]|nr:glycosyltransferase [Bacteroidales bacterium]
MSLKLVMLSTMYPGSLDHFYGSHPGTGSMHYDENLESLISASAEFAASYTRSFRKLGIDTECIIANDPRLQEKWCSGNGYLKLRDEDLLYEQVSSLKPDILWIDNLSLVDDSWYRRVRAGIKSIKVFAGYHCSPVNSKVMEGLGGCDIMFTCTPGLKAQFDSMGKETFLVYHGFDPGIAITQAGDTGKKNIDLVFSGSLTTGTNFHQDRIRLIEEIIRSGIDIKLYVNLENRKRIIAKQALHHAYSILKKTGLTAFTDKIKLLEHGKAETENYSRDLLRRSVPPVYGSDMYSLFARSKIVLNYHIGVAGEYAGNMRMFEVTGMGSCLLTDNKKNLPELFVPGLEVVAYDNPHDCIDKIRWLLENDQEREKIALAGRKKTLEMHTVGNRCSTIAGVLMNHINKS